MLVHILLYPPIWIFNAHILLLRAIFQAPFKSQRWKKLKRQHSTIFRSRALDIKIFGKVVYKMPQKLVKKMMTVFHKIKDDEPQCSITTQFHTFKISPKFHMPPLPSVPHPLILEWPVLNQIRVEEYQKRTRKGK